MNNLSIREAADAWRYPPDLVHHWVKVGNVPGASLEDGIPEYVVQRVRPPGNGHFDDFDGIEQTLHDLSVMESYANDD